MLTKRIYRESTYNSRHESRLIGQGSDEKGHYIILDETIFHPQGGGQPSDIGIIINGEYQMRVNSVRLVGEEIRHYVNQETPIPIGHKLISEIDMKTRLHYARYHTAGHLISQVIESTYQSCKSIKGHHFPGEAYVEFSNASQYIDQVKTTLEQLLAAHIQKGAPVLVNESPVESVQDVFPYIANFSKPGDLVRMVSIKGLSSAPCSGTHVTNISELGQINIESCRTKNDSMRIRYEVL